MENEDKEVSSDKELLSAILEELFEKYKARSTDINLTDVYNNLQIVLSEHTLPFCFTTSSSITMRNELLDSLIRLLEGMEIPILTPNSHRPFSNKDLAVIVRNATKNVDSQLDTIHANFQQHCREHWTDCHDYYYKTHGSSHQMRGRYIGLKDTICSVCEHKGHRYLSCS